MKNLEDMDFAELADYVTGRLIIAIGQGRFREEVATLLAKVLDIGAARVRRK